MSEKPIMEIVDTAAAAAHLSLAPITLAKMRIASGGPRYLKFGRAVRYRLTDLHDWIAGQQHFHTAEYRRVS